MASGNFYKIYGMFPGLAVSCATLAISCQALATDPCADFFSGFSQQEVRKVDTTADFIAYLSVLLELRVMGVQDLSQFVHDLEKGVISNPISETQAKTGSAALIHRE